MLKKVFVVLFFVTFFCGPASGYSQDEIEALDNLMQKLFVESIHISYEELQREVLEEEEIPPSMLSELLE